MDREDGFRISEMFQDELDKLCLQRYKEFCLLTNIPEKALGILLSTLISQITNISAQVLLEKDEKAWEVFSDAILRNVAKSLKETRRVLLEMKENEE